MSARFEVTRTWHAVEASSATEAITASSQRPHDAVVSQPERYRNPLVQMGGYATTHCQHERCGSRAALVDGECEACGWPRLP